MEWNRRLCHRYYWTCNQWCSTCVCTVSVHPRTARTIPSPKNWPLGQSCCPCKECRPWNLDQHIDHPGKEYIWKTASQTCSQSSETVATEAYIYINFLFAIKQYTYMGRIPVWTRVCNFQIDGLWVDSALNEYSWSWCTIRQSGGNRSLPLLWPTMMRVLASHPSTNHVSTVNF